MNDQNPGGIIKSTNPEPQPPVTPTPSVFTPTSVPVQPTAPIAPAVPAETPSAAFAPSPESTPSPVSQPAPAAFMSEPATDSILPPAQPGAVFGSHASPSSEPSLGHETPVTSAAPSAAPTPKKKRKIPALLLPIVLALLVIGGGGAAAYFGYVVPNKPENKLLSGFANLAAQKELIVKGSIDSEIEGTGVAIDYTAQTNIEKNQLSLAGTVGVGGAQFPYELRYIDKSIYAKVGGLDGIGKALPAGSNVLGPYSTLLSSVNDQWFVVDRSFWGNFGSEATCVTDLSFALNKDDIAKIEAAYKKHPLFTVKSSTAAKVDGVDTTKYEVDPASDAEASAFAKELNNLSVVKKVKECAKSTGAEKAFDEEITDISSSTEATGTLYIYLTNDKQIKKLEITAKEKDTTFKMTSTFEYKTVNVTAPTGAKPIQDLLGGLFSTSFSTGL